MWDDRILMFSDTGRWSEHSRAWDRDADERVLGAISKRNGAVQFREIAEELEEVPWSVLAVCRRLSSGGSLAEVDDGVFVLATYDRTR